MSMKITTTIRRMVDSGVGPDDFEDPATYNNLCKAEDSGAEVTVDSCACEGYYNVEIALPHDKVLIVDALAWYHLVGFDGNGPVL